MKLQFVRSLFVGALLSASLLSGCGGSGRSTTSSSLVPQTLTSSNLTSSGKSSFHHGLGALFEPNIKALSKSKMLRLAQSTAVQPPFVDLTPYMPPVGDQGILNSCVGWAVGYELDGYLAARTTWSSLPPSTLLTPTGELSPSFVYNQINGGVDRGSYASDAFTLLQNKGDSTLALMPYSDGLYQYLTQPSQAAFTNGLTHRVSGWHTVDSSANGIRAELALGRPVVYLFDPTSSFEDVGSDGIWSNNDGNIYGGHAVTFIGYDDETQVFKGQNHWGTGWGNNGYFYVPYSLINNTSNESYGYTFNDTPPALAPMIPPPWGAGGYTRSSSYGVPSKIEFSDYDTGGEGVAYHTQHATNLGGQYRSDGVSIQKSTVLGGNGLNVGWMNAGDWYDYSFYVDTPGTYYVQFATASDLPINTPAGQLQIQQFETPIQQTIITGFSDNVICCATTNVVGTNGWQNWTTTAPVAITLSSGFSYGIEETLRIHALASSNNKFGMNVAYMTISTTPQPNPTPIATPTPTPTPTPVNLLTDGTFGTPSVNGGYQYAPADAAPWTYAALNPNTGGSGISANGTAFTYLNPAAPASQVAFIQGAGSIKYQPLTLPAGTYTFSALTAARNGYSGGDSIGVLMDGVQQAQFAPTGFSYESQAVTLKIASAGTHTLMLQGLTNTVNYTTFLTSASLMQIH